MRMYTSYRGMRSTGGGAAPSPSTFRKWVFADTPSLARLMHLPIGVVRGVLAAGPLLGQPGIEARRHQAVGALLPLGGSGGDGVGVFVLGVPGMAFDPAP